MQPINPMDPTYMQLLAETATRASSINVKDRDAAEQEIKQFQSNVDQQTGFVGLLLNMATSNLPSSLFFSIVLKNTVKTCWNSASAEHCIQEVDKAVLRANIIDLMLRTRVDIQRNLAETVAIIADIDFPLNWPTALTLIVETLGSPNTLVVARCAALSTAHSILSKYRGQSELSEVLVSELRTIYSTLLSPLLLSMRVLLDACGHPNSAESVAACKGLTSAVECMLDITALDLADEFLWGMDKVVGLFLECLMLESPRLATDRSGAVVELKSVVTACVTHFLSNYDEDFEKYAGQFLKVIWDTIANPAAFIPEMDDLVISGMELLSSACRGTTRETFNSSESIAALLAQVVVPNLGLQEADIEAYTNEPDVYIQKDIEGSDLHTRRRAAGELVRTLVVSFPDIVPGLLFETVNTLFAEAATNWRSKDTAIFLTTSLALRGNRADSVRGASTQELSTLIPFDNFLRDIVLPELQSGLSPTSPPIIKADCIRVVATFRANIPPDTLQGVLTFLPAWIGHDDPVVYTYAAHALERMLLVQHNDQYVVTELTFAPHAAAVLQSLCVRVQSTDTPNAYLAQCLMRICHRVPEAVRPYVGDVVVSTSAVLGIAARNPSNAHFSHCLFEILSSCIALSPEQSEAIEQVLWENLIYILANDVLEYVPYALQVMGQLLATYPRGDAQPPAKYQGLLEPLTMSSMYGQRGNIPALVYVLSIFIERYPMFVHSQPGGLTQKILNVFHHLLQLKNYDHEGLNILTAMLLSYPRDVMDNYITVALQVLMTRLQSARTPKYVRILIIFMSVAVVVRGAEDVVGRMNGIQPGLFFVFLERVWLPNVKKITGPLERKVCLIALTKLLSDSASVRANQAVCVRCASTCQEMITSGTEEDDYTSFAPKEHTLQDLSKRTQEPQAAGFTNVFCPLKYAVREVTDVCRDITDPVQYYQQRASAAALSGSPA